MCTMYIKKTTASVYTHRPLIRVAVVGITHPTYSYSFHLKHNTHIYIYLYIQYQATTWGICRRNQTGEKHHQIAKLQMFCFFLSSFKALEISKPTKGIALVQVSAKVIRCDFSVFLGEGKPMIKWSNMETWKYTPWKRRNIFQTIIFRFYVNLGGCMFFSVLTLDSAIGSLKNH